MNAAWTLLPLIFIRFVLLGILGRSALTRAAFFPPRAGIEKPAYLIYQLSNILIVIYMFFLRIRYEAPALPVGLAIFGLGTAVLLAAAVNFAMPEESGLNVKGLYRLSRNPMYIGYFLYFLGTVLLTRSLTLLVLLILFQVSAHWIILSEERWCIEKFGKDYISYMKKVRRYF